MRDTSRSTKTLPPTPVRVKQNTRLGKTLAETRSCLPSSCFFRLQRIPRSFYAGVSVRGQRSCLLSFTNPSHFDSTQFLQGLTSIFFKKITSISTILHLEVNFLSSYNVEFRITPLSHLLRTSSPATTTKSNQTFLH